MMIEEGKRYVRRDGRVTEPARHHDNEPSHLCWSCDGPEGFIAYAPDGKCCIDWENVDLMREYVEDKPNTLTPGQTYTSANGDKWECIAVKGDSAWLVCVYSGGVSGAAYQFHVDGTPISLESHPDQYRIVFDPERKTVTCKAQLIGGEIFNDHNWTSSSRNLNITFDTLDGDPDWSTTKVTPA